MDQKFDNPPPPIPTLKLTLWKSCIQFLGSFSEDEVGPRLRVPVLSGWGDLRGQIASTLGFRV